MISMDLKFKGSTTIRIINIYVQCNEKDKDKREKLLNELLKLIKEADQRKFHLVIMGDFNADMERYIAKNKLATRGKYRILQMLLDKGLQYMIHKKLRVLTIFIIHGLEMKIHYEESIIFGFQKG